VSAGLVGPLPVIRFADGTRQAYTPPRNTMDIRYAVCKDHHPACDCREALLAEDVGEYRAMYRDLEQAILAAIKGHQTWAYRHDGWDDEFAQCKCAACDIARAARIGWSECQAQRAEASAALNAAERERAYFAATYPDLNEVPF
jgi:hypothetical protein